VRGSIICQDDVRGNARTKRTWRQEPSFRETPYRARLSFEAAARAYDKYGLKLGPYVGHGIGTAANETPWFVTSDETVPERGMVVRNETDAYGEAASGKCEKTLIVRASGGLEIFPDVEWGVQV
jgi:hypothetical protein